MILSGWELLNFTLESHFLLFAAGSGGRGRGEGQRVEGRQRVEEEGEIGEQRKEEGTEGEGRNRRKKQGEEGGRRKGGGRNRGRAKMLIKYTFKVVSGSTA